MDTILHSLLLGVTGINLVIIALLLYVYAKNFRYIKSKYNMGLLIFSSLFFIENALIMHLGIFQWPVIASDIIVSHIVLIDIIQLFGLLVLLYVTWK